MGKVTEVFEISEEEIDALRIYGLMVNMLNATREIAIFQKNLELIGLDDIDNTSPLNLARETYLGDIVVAYMGIPENCDEVYDILFDFQNDPSMDAEEALVAMAEKWLEVMPEYEKN